MYLTVNGTQIVKCHTDPQYSFPYVLCAIFAVKTPTMNTPPPRIPIIGRQKEKSWNVKLAPDDESALRRLQTQDATHGNGISTDCDEGVAGQVNASEISTSWSVDDEREKEEGNDGGQLRDVRGDPTDGQPGSPKAGAQEPARRSFASLALASGTGEDVAALMSGAQKRRWRLDRTNAKAILIAVAVCVLAAWAWLALIGSEGDEKQDKLIEERGASSISGSRERGKADRGKTNDSGKKGSAGARGEGGATTTSTTASSIVVYVSGAVKTPGVYTLAGGSRVDDAVRAAGGMTDRAESTGTNLAALVNDGEHVHVLAVGEPPSAPEASNATSVPSSGGKGGGKKRGGAKTTVNINTATAEQLQSLPGVGPATSKAIIAWRDENGRFTSVDDLLNVSGIGKATLAKLRDHVSV